MGAYEAAGETDEWYTPPHVFDALGCAFDMDVAAPADQAHIVTPAHEFIAIDSLSVAWSGFIWMNPPFGNQATKRAWLAKFFDHGNGIALTPDRTSAAWFHEAWARADLVMFTPRIKFVRPDGTVGKSPGTGTCLWASGDRAMAALRHAERAGLGVLAKPCK